ncbi:MAG: cobalt ABC transporter ATP-binding protein [Microbacterium sp. 67-17]|uniref:energy-coupling factor ABC transporter ATP-binding protein n=1 Tax=Microbacterium sp. 67-17 TaxID=1895782 RepID=UPI000965F5D5|nr:ABC transporter ATP-binding protein [Microbacterium sp. 67-17]OJV97250.1 MAG: cobalt ABC transporter ATP-binding protein [Microbacterium sp. 67-17]
MSSASVSVRGVGFAYPSGARVLHEVDLEIAAGERVAVLGPNGAGKTTLMLHLNGIHLPDRGVVEIGGTPVGRGALPEIRRRVGVVFQDPDDQLFLPTVGEDVAFGPGNYGVRGPELESRVTEALTQVGLEHHRDTAPGRLSLGQRRRAAIATILSMDVEVIVLDEPTSNLDPRARRDLSATLDALDATIIVVTHDLPYALELCPRSVILDEGRIVADGSTVDILSDADLLSAHGLELPWGFDPRAPRPPRDAVTGRGSAPGQVRMPRAER